MAMLYVITRANPSKIMNAAGSDFPEIPEMLYWQGITFFLARKIYAVGLLPESSDNEKAVFFRRIAALPVVTELPCNPFLWPRQPWPDRTVCQRSLHTVNRFGQHAADEGIGFEILFNPGLVQVEANFLGQAANCISSGRCASE